MSEETTPKKVEIDVFKPDAIINIEVSGYFVMVLQNILFKLSNQMGNEAVKTAMEKFKDATQPPSDLDELILFTVISLVSECEQAAIKQNKTVKEEMTAEEVLKRMNFDVSES